jgi:nitrate reductase NapE component
MEDKRCPDCPGDLNCNPRERQKRYKLMTLDRYRHEKTVQLLEKINNCIYFLYLIILVWAILIINTHGKTAATMIILDITVSCGLLILITFLQYLLRIKPMYFPPPCSAIINLDPRWAWLHKRIKLVQRIRLIFLFGGIGFIIWFLFTLDISKMAFQIAGMMICLAVMTWATIYEYKLKK